MPQISTTNDVVSEYFSGQGVVLIGSRDINGKPTGLRPLGNVSDLKIDIATTVINHKGSQDGQRAIDARLQTETNATATVTLDNWVAANLAKALRGDPTTIAAGVQTAETVLGYAGLVTGLQYVNISGLVLSEGEQALTGYVNDGTPYDYKVNLAAGSVLINDGLVTPTAKLGSQVTGLTVGETTVIDVVNEASVGDLVTLNGFTGANASVLNGISTTVTAATGNSITVAVNTTGDTITTAAGTIAFFPGDVIVLTATYSYTAQTLTDALTEPLQDSFLRFEGLNTVGENAPVVVEIFRFSNDPLKELALISDTFGQFELEGAVLTDATRVTGSKYFTVKKLV